MKIKYKLLTLAIVSFMVLTSAFVTSDSFAYWSTTVAPSSDTATATVTTGTWQQIYEWSPTGTYVTGDIVTNNGQTYQAKTDNPTKEPGVSKGWQSDWNRL